MELTDQRDIAAPPDVVWSALTDADVLKQCIPGCQEMSGNLQDGYECVAVQKVGPVKATFKAQIGLSNVVEGQSCTISGEGKGGPAGFAKGGADVVLTPTDGGTRLSYDVTAKVGGKLAQLGSRVIDGFAKKMADQFFDKFKTVVEGGGDASTSVDAGGDAIAAAAPAPAPAPAPKAEAAAGGSATPRPGSDDPTAPPAPPDAPQTDKQKKGWFRKLMG